MLGPALVSSSKLFLRFAEDSRPGCYGEQASQPVPPLFNHLPLVIDRVDKQNMRDLEAELRL